MILPTPTPDPTKTRTEPHPVIQFGPLGNYLAGISLDYFVPVWDVQNGTSVATIISQEPIVQVYFSPDETRLLTTSRDGTAHLYELPSGEELAIVKEEGLEEYFRYPAAPIHFTADSSRVILQGDNGHIHILRTSDGKEIALVKTEGEVIRFTLNESGTRLAVVSSTVGEQLAVDSDITRIYYIARLIDVNTGEVYSRIQVLGMIYWPVFSPDETQVAFPGGDGRVYLLNSENGTELGILAHSPQIFYLQFSPDSSLLAASGNNSTLRLWRVPPNQEPAIFRIGDQARQILFSPDGSRFCAAAEDGHVILFDIKNISKIAEFQHQSFIRDMGFSPDGSRLAIAGEDGVVRLINSITGRLLVSKDFSERIWSLDFSAHGTQLAIAAGDKVTILNPDNGQTLGELRYSDIITVKYGSKENFLAAGGFSHGVQLWDSASGKLIEHLIPLPEVNVLPFPPSYAIWKIIFNQDNSRLAAASYKTVFLWNLETQQIIAEPHRTDQDHFPTRPVSDIEFSPNGMLLATTSEDGTGRIINAMTGEEIALLLHKKVGPQPDGSVSLLQVTDIDFSPKGDMVATAAYDKTARLWDLTGKELMVISHNDFVTKIEFSPDGKLLATASRDGLTHVVDTTTLTEVAVLQNVVEVNDLAFSPDGKYLVTAGADGVVRFWYAQLEVLKEIACQTLSRNFSTSEWRIYLGDLPYRETCPGLPIPKSPEGEISVEGSTGTNTAPPTSLSTPTRTPSPTQTPEPSYPYPPTMLFPGYESPTFPYPLPTP